MGGREEHQGLYRKEVSRKGCIKEGRVGRSSIRVAKQKARGSNRNWAVQESRRQRGWGPRGSRAQGCILLQLTRSRPPVASLHPSVLKLQQFTGAVCPLSSVPQGKSSAFCGSVSNGFGHSLTVKSSALEIEREEDSLKEEARQAPRPKTKAIMGLRARSEGTAPREGSNKSQAVERPWTRSSYHLSTQDRMPGTPSPALQLSLQLPTTPPDPPLPKCPVSFGPSLLPRED